MALHMHPGSCLLLETVTMDLAVLELRYALFTGNGRNPQVDIQPLLLSSCQMVQYSLSSPGASSQSSEESAKEIGFYHFTEHESTYGVSDNLVASAARDRNGVDRTLSFPVTTYRPFGDVLRSHLVPTPLPKPPRPGNWPHTPILSPSPASSSRFHTLNRPIPRPPAAFPPISPYTNRIAPAQDSPEVADVLIPGSTLPTQSTWLAKRRRYKPVGRPYKSTGSRMAPMGVPTSPQKHGIERSWVTWYHDGSTRNFIPALATEIVRGLEDMKWTDIMYLVQTTNHPHLIRLLDGSQFPKRDPKTGDFARWPPGPEGSLVEKSATDLANLAGWDEQQWKKQRIAWRRGRACTDFKVMPDLFPHPFLVWERMNGSQLSVTLKKRPDGVEEEFVWYFLISILDAARWLHHGQPDRLRPDGNDWCPELRYGTIKLGDFSRAIILDPGTANSLESTMREDRFLLASHTRTPQQEDFEAPELSWLLDTDPAKNGSSLGAQSTTSCQPIGGRSDIWSIGAVGVALMGGIWIDPGDASLLRWTGITRERAFVLQTLQLYKLGGKRWDIVLLPQNYSRTLRAVLERLLTLDPLRRPDAKEALALVSKGYEKWSTERGPSQSGDDTDDGIESDVDGYADKDDEDFNALFSKSPTIKFKAAQTSKRNLSKDDNADEDNRPPKKRNAGYVQTDKPSRISSPHAGPRRDRQRYNISGRPRGKRSYVADAAPFQDHIEHPSHAVSAAHASRSLFASEQHASQNNPKPILQSPRVMISGKKAVSFAPEPQYESTPPPRSSPVSGSRFEKISRSATVQTPSQNNVNNTARVDSYDRTLNPFGFMKRRSSTLAAAPEHQAGEHQIDVPQALPMDQTWKTTDGINFVKSSSSMLNWSTSPLSSQSRPITVV
ncbi:hypothetical protein CERZMDRAFT_103112 [Cercospora zeae-maydis SCOH1-5]|uniref:non-specific serine/threonine protein kinase n=1 Tax=Cercospora zeae-maydis SCOH1-5 TaxID=717836 RepID=A0A6A6EWT6_9PEZI|nr:hypothetical protein CERZMDRAFT_103112 [Cercospora zeae-maydis SCOH1-5]